MFNTFKCNEDEINVPQLYNEFTNTNHYLKLSFQGGSSSLKKIGNMYEKGEDQEVDYQKAMQFYKKAADLNDPKAQSYYGSLLQEIGIDNKPDLVKGAEYLKKSALKGNIHGMANYGIALLNGHGVEKNLQKAEEYLKKSADKGYAFAQINYGYTIIKNKRTPERINEGLKYIRKAMDQKYHEAFCTYAYMLKKGKYLVKNDKLAMEYFKIAADMGNDDAMIEYGDGRMNGIGVPKNEKIALQYYQLAAFKDNEQNKENISNERETQHVVNQTQRNQIKQISPPSNDIPNNIDQNPPRKTSNVSLPTQISPAIKLVSLGQVVYDRPNYHTKKYIYPVGYRIERQYYSIEDPRKIAVYRSTVIDGGESPKFRVECLDNSKMIFESNSPSRPWNDASSAIEESKKRLGLQQRKKAQISGPCAFGFTLNTITYLIDHLPNADKCTNHEFQKLYVKDFDKEIEGGREVVFGNYSEEASRLRRSIQSSLDQLNANTSTSTNTNTNTNQEDHSQFSMDEESDSSIEENEPSQIIFNFNKPVEELIRIGDELYNQKDPSYAFRYYKEAVNRGCSDAYLKCAEIAPTLESQIEYYELAISNNVPDSFRKCRKFIFKKLFLSIFSGKQRYFSQFFEKLEDFSDAAYIYKMLKDKINFQISYEQAKENIEKVKDCYQQYFFGLLAQGQHEYELAKLLFKKAAEKGVQQANNKIAPPPLPLEDPSKWNQDNYFFKQGLKYYTGNEFPLNYEIAMELFLTSSKKGCIIANYYIGNFYEDEFGAECLKKSADAGYPKSQNRYAYYLKKGIGVSIDLIESMKYYKLAADQGDIESIFEYGKMKYELGKTEEEKKEGISYIKQSAEEMLPDALYMYSKVISVTNPHDSKKFYDYSILKKSRLALKEQERMI